MHVFFEACVSRFYSVWQWQSSFSRFLLGMVLFLLYKANLKHTSIMSMLGAGNNSAFINTFPAAGMSHVSAVCTTLRTKESRNSSLGEPFQGCPEAIAHCDIASYSGHFSGWGPPDPPSRSSKLPFIASFLSTPVLMHGGLLCITVCPSVCDWTKILGFSVL